MHIYKLSKVPDNILITENPRTRAANKVKFKLGRLKLQVVKKSPLARGAILWNSLDKQAQLLDTRAKFKAAISSKDFAAVKLRHAVMR